MVIFRFGLFATSLSLGAVILIFVKVISGMAPLEGFSLFSQGSKQLLTIVAMLLILASLGFLFLVIAELRKK